MFNESSNFTNLPHLSKINGILNPAIQTMKIVWILDNFKNSNDSNECGTILTGVGVLLFIIELLITITCN